MIKDFLIRIIIFIILAFVFNIASEILSTYWPKKLENKISKAAKKYLYYISEGLLIITITGLTVFLFTGMGML